MSGIQIEYRFSAPDGTTASFPLTLDSQTLELPRPDGELPEWTRLDFRQCPHCPLDLPSMERCPVAAHLPRLVSTFNHLVSHDRVQVEVLTAERTYLKELPIQGGLGALMGLIMATSGCPIMTFFRPMARFHLPFATQDETIFRAVSAYLLADYLRTRKGQETRDSSLEGLKRVYEDVHRLNEAFSYRLRVAARTDSSLNALVHLDMFALMLPMQIEMDLPAVLDYFRPFLQRAGTGNLSGTVLDSIPE